MAGGKRIVYEAALRTRSFDQGVARVEMGTRRMTAAVTKFNLAWRHFHRGNYDRSLTLLGQAATQAGGRLFNMGRTGFNALTGMLGMIKRVFDFLARLGMKVVMVGGLLAGLGLKSVAHAAEFESEISRVAILSGAKPGERGMLRDSAMKTGIKTPFTLTDIAQSQKQFAQIGFNPTEIVRLVEATSLLATLGGSDMDMATAGEALAQVMQQFNIPTEKATETALKLGGALIDTALNGQELFDAMKDAGSAAGIFGADLTEVLAIVGHLRKSLGSAEKTSVAVRNLFLAITSIAGKSDKQLEDMDFTREEAQELSFMRNPGLSLVEVIKGLAKKFEGNPEMIAKAGVERRTILAFKAIEQTATETFDALKRGINDIETTMRKAVKIFELLDNKLKRVKASAGAVFIALGNRITSAFGVEDLIDGLTNKLGDLGAFLDTMSDEKFKQLASKFGDGLIQAISTAMQFMVEVGIAAAPLWAKAMFDAAKGVAEGLLSSDEFLSYKIEAGAMSPDQREATAEEFRRSLVGKMGFNQGQHPKEFTRDALAEFFATAPSGVAMHLKSEGLGLGRTRGRRAEALLEVLEAQSAINPYMEFFESRLKHAITAAQGRLSSNPAVLATRDALSQLAEWPMGRPSGGGHFTKPPRAGVMEDHRNFGVQNIYGFPSGTQRAKPVRPVGRIGQESAQR